MVRFSCEALKAVRKKSPWFFVKRYKVSQVCGIENLVFEMLRQLTGHFHSDFAISV